MAAPSHLKSIRVLLPRVCKAFEAVWGIPDTLHLEVLPHHAGPQDELLGPNNLLEVVTGGVRNKKKNEPPTA
eukprot:1159947-Pelagomonas_calceolata.AAC.7